MSGAVHAQNLSFKVIVIALEDVHNASLSVKVNCLREATMAKKIALLICLGLSLSTAFAEDDLPLQLGDSCTEPGDCTIPSSTCSGEETDYRCFCNEGFFASADKNRCLRRAEFLEDKCELDAQCTHFFDAECHDTFLECRCKPNHVPNDLLNRCYIRRFNLDDQCTIPRQCSMEGGTCINNVCACKSDYIIHEKQCLPLLNTIQIDVCIINEQCPANSECKSNGQAKNCICKTGYVRNNAWKECLIVRDLIGGVCTESQQCAVAHSECKDDGGIKICACSLGYVSDLSNRAICYKEANNLGDECAINKQCLVDKAVCQDGKCGCRPGTIESANSCLDKLNTIENEKCFINEQCPANSFCRSFGNVKQCSCISGFVKSSDGTACLKALSSVGDICVDSNQCVLANSVCTANDSGANICKCADGFIANSAKNTCEQIASSVDSPCKFQEQCDSINGWCQGPFGMQKCVCKPSTEPTIDNLYCEPNSLGSPCTVTGDCSKWTNSDCAPFGIAKICKCNSNFVENNAKDECLPVVTNLNEVCTDSEQCLIDDSACIGETGAMTCQCAEGFVPDSGNTKCLKRADLINDSCEISAQCNHISGGAICNSVADQCRCLSTHVPSTDLTRCLRKVSGIGVACEQWNQCSTMNAICDETDLVCVCNDNFITAGNNCLRVAGNLGESCFIPQQCPFGNSTCKDGACSCTSEFISSSDNKNCLPLASFLCDPCSESAQCSTRIPSSHCEAGVCTCDPLMEPTPENNECVPIPLNIGESCTEGTTECPAESSCTGTTPICTCNADFVPMDDDSGCLPVAPALDSDCIQSDQCSVPFPNSFCSQEDKCICKDLYVANNARNKCLLKLTDFETTCEEAQQCSAEGALGNAICGETTKKCECITGYVKNTAGDKCIKGANFLGESCVDDVVICDTIDNSVCHATDKVCTCISDFVASLDLYRCLPVTGDTLGGPCVENQQCDPKIPNSACRESVCSCRNEFVAALDTKSCLPYADHGEACLENSQCVLTPGEVSCVDSKCACKASNHFLEEICWVDRKLGETCADKRECILADGKVNKVDCLQSKCACVEGFVADVNANLCNSGVQIAVTGILLVLAAFSAKFF
ncbi:fibrillin-2-like [Neocloeon triangulifer]|uniref:fibrillin-2-like n=1 Tax=Neocloeon triangulifer TaxID=2078957 RepID=UPI00286F92F2|nr:fibrillin-2-like [Neocloeon triangulifer]